MASANLAITDVTPGQDGKVNRINQSRNNLELAVTNRLSKAMGDANVTLTTTEAGEALGNLVYVFTGANTAQRDVLVPTNTKLYIVENATTGGFGVRVLVSGQTGVVVPPGVKKTLYCNGTDIEEVGSGATGFIQTLPFGTTKTAFGSGTFLDTIGGLVGTTAIGYEATRSGSVIGVGVNLEVVTETAAGTILVEVLVAGTAVFSATITTSGTGRYQATATQGAGIDAVAAGDAISMRITFGTFTGTVTNIVAHSELLVDL